MNAALVEAAPETVPARAALLEKLGEAAVERLRLVRAGNWTEAQRRERVIHQITEQLEKLNAEQSR